MTQGESSLPEQEGLIPLPTPVPPSLEGALGYNGEGRFLALWWEPAGDEATWSDGRTTTDAWWHGFLTYVQHPKVEPYLLPYDLGSSEQPAVHCLLTVDHDAIERERSSKSNRGPFFLPGPLPEESQNCFMGLHPPSLPQATSTMATETCR